MHYATHRKRWTGQRKWMYRRAVGPANASFPQYASVRAVHTCCVRFGDTQRGNAQHDSGWAGIAIEPRLHVLDAEIHLGTVGMHPWSRVGRIGAAVQTLNLGAHTAVLGYPFFTRSGRGTRLRVSDAKDAKKPSRTSACNELLSMASPLFRRRISPELN